MKKPLLMIVFALLIPVLLFAQEEQKPKKYENAEWYRVVYVKYHSGKMAEATSIINDYYRPVANKLGRDYTTYELISGEWDIVTFFKLDEGISAYEWETSAQGIEWRRELIKQVGSEEKMSEIEKQYSNCVSDSKREIVRKKVWK